MNSKQARLWLSAVCAILVGWGVVFAFFGLGVLPVDKEVLLPWESSLYGAIMIGWGTTLLFVGTMALRRHDAELLKCLLLGIAVWLTIEALFSARFGVWFNVGVDVVVLLLLSAPLIWGIRSHRTVD
jgi:hypothetical protein